MGELRCGGVVVCGSRGDSGVSGGRVQSGISEASVRSGT